MDQGEENNKILKSEYRNFQYKKTFTSKYEVAIREKTMSFQICHAKRMIHLLKQLIQDIIIMLKVL